MIDLSSEVTAFSLKVLFATGEFHPATAYGGPTVSNLQLCQSLQRKGLIVSVLATNSNGTTILKRKWQGRQTCKGLNVYYARRWLRPDIAPDFMWEFRKLVPSQNVVHLSAAYHWFLPMVARICFQLGKPLLVSPRGALFPAARIKKSFKKQIYEKLCGNLAFRRVTCFHATSQAESEAIRTFIPSARVSVIPNGIDIPKALPYDKGELAPYLLYLGRLHPYKKVDRIISAFASATKQIPTADGQKWTLVIAGDGEVSYRQILEQTAMQCAVAERVLFMGQVSGENKTGLLTEAAFVVQAPNPENFGNVVAEALAHGTPVLVGKGLPWESLHREHCGLWVDDSEAGLFEGMCRLMALSYEERKAMGWRGRAWMQRDFSWEKIAGEMSALYEDLATKAVSTHVQQ